MEKVRYGIIGIGNMGTTHLKNLMEGKIENAVVTCVADLKEERRNYAKETYPELTVFSTGDELIEKGDIDAVIIVVPHYFHPYFAIKAFEKNLNVVCEKPAGVYTKQVKEMIEASKKSKGLFTMMFNQRTNCLYRKMREMVMAGEIGEVKRINWIITDWFRTQAYYDSGEWRATWSGEGGGVLFNQSPHQLDLIQWVPNMSPKRVRAYCNFGKYHDIEVEDDVTAYFEYENGATGVFITTTGDAPGTNRFELTGTLGKLICENDVLTFVKNDVEDRVQLRNEKNAYKKPNTETITVETDGQNPQHVGILRNFTNAILGKEPLFVQGEEGLKGVELQDACLLSEWTDQMVTLPIDDDLYLSELNKRIATSKKKAHVTNTFFDTSKSY
ncbi:MAG: Gfo/Idh/MocA family oxidoreductase [Clostridiales bacterium]|nr:Gfo/Idh/MocA family oxidoreductase [Clostridiales bacterium]